MPADEDGRLRRRLAEQALDAIEWGADGTFSLVLHTHPPGEPCPPDTCDTARRPPREHGPHYCQGCGTVWYTRTPAPSRCPICAARITEPPNPAAGLWQHQPSTGFTIPLEQASPENLAAAMGNRYRDGPGRFAAPAVHLTRFNPCPLRQDGEGGHVTTDNPAAVTCRACRAGLATAMGGAVTWADGPAENRRA